MAERLGLAASVPLGCPPPGQASLLGGRHLQRWPQRRWGMHAPHSGDPTEQRGLSSRSLHHPLYILFFKKQRGPEWIITQGINFLG